MSDSLANLGRMSDLTKMMLFMFLGLVVAILVLGFSRSPKASPQLGAEVAGAKTRPSSVLPLNKRQVTPQSQTSKYNRRDY